MSAYPITINWATDCSIAEDGDGNWGLRIAELPNFDLNVFFEKNNHRVIGKGFSMKGSKDARERGFVLQRGEKVTLRFTPNQPWLSGQNFEFSIEDRWLDLQVGATLRRACDLKFVPRVDLNDSLWDINTAPSWDDLVTVFRFEEGKLPYYMGDAVEASWAISSKELEQKVAAHRRKNCEFNIYSYEGDVLSLEQAMIYLQEGESALRKLDPNWPLSCNATVRMTYEELTSKPYPPRSR